MPTTGSPTKSPSSDLIRHCNMARGFQKSPYFDLIWLTHFNCPGEVTLGARDFLCAISGFGLEAPRHTREKISGTQGRVRSTCAGKSTPQVAHARNITIGNVA